MSNYIRTRRKNRNFTVIGNAIFGNPTLSAKAVGLFCYLLSLPDDWKLYITELSNHFSDGETSIRSGLKELEAVGFIKVEQERDADGKWLTPDYILDDNPQQLGFTSVDERDTAERNPAERNPAEQSLLNTNKQKTNTTNSSSRPTPTTITSKKLFTGDKKELKNKRFVEARSKLLKEFEFSETIEDKLLDFLEMLTNMNTYLPEITIRMQFKKLTELSITDQLTAINNTLTRGWKSLDYAVDNIQKTKTPSFDTSKPGSFQPKDPNNDVRYKDYVGEEVF